MTENVNPENGEGKLAFRLRRIGTGVERAGQAWAVVKNAVGPHRVSAALLAGFTVK
ncbi:MAG: hypothetical protein JXN61_01190 [Sedimentisphaerales bacterium]|nr:hypothetical protein [Sedimentisphaerales bacterium]